MTEQPVDARPGIDALTGIRIIAAAWVVLFHLRDSGLLPQLLPASERFAWFIKGGYLGVDLFFTLSGFIIAYNYLSRFERVTRGQYRRFLRLRLARIYPVHAATLLAALALFLGARAVGLDHNADGIYGTGSFVANVLLVHAWGTATTSWNYPAWSISAEWFAYLLFPFVAMGINRAGITSVRRAAGVALAVAAVGGLLLHEGPHRWSPLIRVSTEFLVGCLLFLVYRGSRRRPRAYGALLLVLLLVTLVVVAVSNASTLAVAPLLMLLVLATASAGGPIVRMLSAGPMVLWGQISYSVYMTHAIVILVLNQVVDPLGRPDDPLLVRCAIVLTYIAVIATVAAATFYLVEQPCRRSLRGRPVALESRSVAP